MRRPAALFLLSGLLFPCHASGQTPAANPVQPNPMTPPNASAPTAVPAPETDREETPIVPPATDTVKGRFTLSLMGGLVVPFGSLEREIPWRDAAGLGLGGDVEPTFGLSRSVMVGAWLHASQLGAGGQCSECSTRSVAGGPLVRFHLVQGLKLDPWVSVGVGPRSIVVSADDDFAYLGFDWMRFTVGADWYASSNLAVAPFMQLLGGASIDRPDAPPVGERPFDDHGAVYWTFTAGLRLSLSFPGR
jgi:hypothetical protein